MKPKVLLGVNFGAFVTDSSGGLFLAMTSDWGGGVLRPNGELLKILRTAKERRTPVRMELLRPKIDFGPSQTVTLTNAAVVRATDADLR